MNIADIIVVGIIALALFFIIRKMVKNVKEGKGLDGGCSGDCSKCGGCSGSCNIEDKSKY